MFCPRRPVERTILRLAEGPERRAGRRWSPWLPVLLAVPLAGLAGAACFIVAGRARPHLRTSAATDTVLEESPQAPRSARGLGADDPEAPGTARGPGAEGLDWVKPEEPEPRLDDHLQAVVAKAMDAAQEWDVVYEGASVNVRSRMEMDSEVQAIKVKGDVIFGRQVGEWVELLDGTGYVKIFLDPANATALVERSHVSYAELVSGRCRDVGMHPISLVFACQGVGFALGHPDKNVETYYGQELVRPEGCYLLEETGQLWLAMAQSNRGNGAGRLRRPICSSRAKYAGGV